MSPVDSEDTVLEGVLVPVEWGPSGEVLDVGLMTFDENEYRIDSATTRDHSLKDHLQKHVRLSTLIRDGRVIQVRRVEMLESKNLGSSQRAGGFCDEHDESGSHR